MENNTHDPQGRVFDNEIAFLAAESRYTGENGKSSGYVVTQGEKVFWVWAANRDHATGLVSRRLALLTVIPYQRTRALAALPESEILALFGSLSQDLQDKVRRHLNGHSCPYCPDKLGSRPDLTAHIKRKHPAQAKS